MEIERSDPDKSGNLPENFFDSDKKSKKEQQDEITKAMEEWEREVAACEDKAKQEIEDELEMQQNDRNIDELDQQLEQWKRFSELEMKAEKLRAKVTLKKKSDVDHSETAMDQGTEGNSDHEVVDEDRLFDWRSKGL